MRRRPQPGWLWLAFATLALNALLLASHYLPFGNAKWAWLAVEAPLLVGLFALMPRRRWSGGLAWSTAIALVPVAMIALADAGVRASLGRPLNLYTDVSLLPAAYDLLAGATGAILAIALLLGLVVITGTLIAVTAQLLLSVRGAQGDRGGRREGIALLVVASLGVVGDDHQAFASRVESPTVGVVIDQATLVSQTVAARERFATTLSQSARDSADRDTPLAALAGVDVILAFIESYGTVALDDPRYASAVLPRLADLEKRVRAAGLSIASGALVSPVQGGRSWLAHASLLSGLWVDSHPLYGLLVASDRRTLIDDFRRLGHRSVAVMPAITMPWPEGERLGYERVYAAQDLGYAGPALNWVTMPDQYVWSFLEREIRPATGQALFVELALISSHAPWTPILPILDDWDDIGDGAIFARWADAGATPEALWRNTERVRRHFALAVDYALGVIAGYAERFVNERTLLIALGDHQPAPLIAGEQTPRTVPVHVISGDPALVQPFLRWGFKAGALPRRWTEAPRMDEFRGWFVEAFSGASATTAKWLEASDRRGVNGQ